MIVIYERFYFFLSTPNLWNSVNNLRPPVLNLEFNFCMHWSIIISLEKLSSLETNLIASVQIEEI